MARCGANEAYPVCQVRQIVETLSWLNTATHSAVINFKGYAWIQVLKRNKKKGKIKKQLYT